MSRNFFSEIHLHITWHTKLSRPLLTPAIETETHHYLNQRLIRTPDVYCHAIGGTETHVHLALTVAPTILVSDLIGQLKDSSSHEINQKMGGRQQVLQWQAGYGVVSFGTRNLDWVCEYIRNQKERHAQRRLISRLERFAPPEQPETAQAPQREAP